MFQLCSLKKKIKFVWLVIKIIIFLKKKFKISKTVKNNRIIINKIKIINNNNNNRNNNNNNNNNNNLNNNNNNSNKI